MSAVWRWYSRMVDKYPWGSQILQTGVLCATGDIIAQVTTQLSDAIPSLALNIYFNTIIDFQVAVEQKSLDKFELSRVGRFFIMGSCVVCPCVR